MRVLRVLVGVLLLIIAVPTLLVGIGTWYAMQHRDSHGEFRAALQTVARPGYAVVVPDLDALLRRDAPFTRAGRTGLTVSVTGKRQMFLGIAAPADVVEVLGQAGYTRIDQVRLGRGPLQLRSTAFAGTDRPPVAMPMQAIWMSIGTNHLVLDPSAWRGKNVALVVTAVDGEPLGDVNVVAALDPHWLDSAAWGLVIVGPVLLLLGFVVLAWPARSRPVLYVLETVPGPPTASSRSFPAQPAAPAQARTGAAQGNPAGAPAGRVPTIMPMNDPMWRTVPMNDPTAWDRPMNGQAWQAAPTNDPASGPSGRANPQGRRAVPAAGAGLPMIARSAALPAGNRPTSEYPCAGTPASAQPVTVARPAMLAASARDGGESGVPRAGQSPPSVRGGQGDRSGRRVPLETVTRPSSDLPGWPLTEIARRTERALNAPTAEMPQVVVSPLEIPTAEMPLVGPPVRMRLSRQ